MVVNCEVPFWFAFFVHDVYSQTVVRRIVAMMLMMLMSPELSPVHKYGPASPCPIGGI